MTTQIAVRDDTLRELEDSFAIAVRQRELLENYIKERLTPGKHFYKMSADQKNSLTKEGAELICLPHGYKPAYIVDAGPDQPPVDDTPYQITVRCTLMKGERFEGEGIGSASSHITKKTGERVVRQRDPGLRHNATLKMAQKSAYIAATLNATAASEFFTQDMEDVAETSGSDSTSSPRTVDAEFFCTEHKVAYARHENDKGEVWYSHKKADGKYHNMPKTAAPVQATSQETVEPPMQAEAPSEPTPVVSGGDRSFANLGVLYAAAGELGFTTHKARMDVPGVQEAIEAQDYSKAYRLMVAAKAQTAKAVKP